MISDKDSYISNFLEQESAGGILLMVSAVVAIILANTPFSTYYNLLIETPVAVQVGALKIDKPLLLWVNDGMMAVFFLLVGLELKREFLEGELSDPKKIFLPGLGAIGGMAIPALIYILLNQNDPVAMKGWAIPAATDIAFALGVLTLLGSRVPTSLKVFLTSLAIFDDIGAILIIAFFYTSNISTAALIVAAACIVVLFFINKRGVTAISVYVAIGVILWVALLKSGVHATLAGVVLAMFIPNKSASESEKPPLKILEHDLHSMVAFIILPVFAFCNSGITLTGLGADQIFHSIPMGIALGLFIGKQVGIFALCWLGVKIGITKLPADVSWSALYGTAIICGIGFTMSLFIGSLAFEETGVNYMFDERLGIILGSLASGILGYVVLKSSVKGTQPG